MGLEAFRGTNRAPAVTVAPNDYRRGQIVA